MRGRRRRRPSIDAYAPPTNRLAGLPTLTFRISSRTRALIELGIMAEYSRLVERNAPLRGKIARNPWPLGNRAAQICERRIFPSNRLHRARKGVMQSFDQLE